MSHLLTPQSDWASLTFGQQLVEIAHAMQRSAHFFAQQQSADRRRGYDEVIELQMNSEYTHINPMCL
jgi:hypothetical protein